ncbi:MAG: DUF433 domain-containing protein [Bacteroidia bacterium]|nr:DUF433 domain-containing protein [Bacteroidia bacterium]
MYKRITINPQQMNGEPCIRGLRIPVATILILMSQCHTIEEILAFYPDLERDDILEALNFAAHTVTEREIPLLKSA